MTREVIELSPGDADPAVSCDREVSFIPAAERQMQAPDCRVAVVERGSLVARCSCWWSETAKHAGRRVGVIGHYASSGADSAGALLSRACEILASNGCRTAIGPMDGTTWRRYRFIVERGSEPPFFLEPDNPDDWPELWTQSGFAPLAAYTSALSDRLTHKDPRAAAARPQIASAGISIRPIDLARANSELGRIYSLSLAAFARNFLYTPISEQEFLAQYDAVLPYVRHELVLLAEKDGALVGFMFALPDMLEARRGTIDTVIMKTLAVDPSVGGIGLGGVLMDDAHRAARDAGFHRAIHALIHEGNVSRRISDRYARTIRRYALFTRPLPA